MSVAISQIHDEGIASPINLPLGWVRLFKLNTVPTKSIKWWTDVAQLYAAITELLAITSSYCFISK